MEESGAARMTADANRYRTVSRRIRALLRKNREGMSQVSEDIESVLLQTNLDLPPEL